MTNRLMSRNWEMQEITQNNRNTWENQKFYKYEKSKETRLWYYE